MADEHAPQFSGFGGHPLVKTPHLDRLVERGVLFENAYCNSPLCVPSRMSFMTGTYPHHNGAWDNTTALDTDAPTWAHLLRAAGYDAVLSGKQHFIGPDQLHGFRAQLARDLHAERTHGQADWSEGVRPAPRAWPGLEQARPGTSEEIEVDDLVEQAALDYIHDPARRTQPWALNIGFIAPHFPLIVPQRYWDLYPLDQIDMPEAPAALGTQHPVFERMRVIFGLADYSDDLVRIGRQGYYALISYLDEKVGRLIAALEETGQLENTLVVYTSDHGEMNGEHGMWRKSNFYEHSVRVPLILSWPGSQPGDTPGTGSASGLPAGRLRHNVSLVDVVATMLDAAGVAPVAPLDGRSLLPLARGEAGAEDAWDDTVFSEYLAHGVIHPVAMLRRGRYKLIYSLDDPPLLFDVEADPFERHDLSADPAYATVLDDLRARLFSDWNPVGIEQRVRQGQRERLTIRRAIYGASYRADSSGHGHTPEPGTATPSLRSA